MGLNCLVLVAVFVAIFAGVFSLQCYQCGQYNDGVGSITPCINETYMVLKECPSKNHAFCIKYISEGSIVKDCVAKCTDREDWGARTLCCDEDACNSAPSTKLSQTSSVLAGLLFTAIAILFRH